ncbi:MAG: hypothetical protein M0R40_09910 [Firmicutes bacterium]|nr:hypothetical protein [Bacillota bacterium]
MQLSSEYSSIKELTRVYEKMEPSAAAKILLQYDDKDVVSSIIKNMSAPKAAEVLSEMDAPSAAQLLSRFDSRD